MSIIGNGIIANAIIDREDLVFFASGVPDSAEFRESEYQREVDLLMKQDFDKHIVYFSTLSIYFTDSRYTQHKRHMEELIKRHFKHYTIMRIGNPTWAGNNKKHLINFFRDKIAKKEKFLIRNVYRYLIDIDEFQHWLGLIRVHSCDIMNITGRRMKVKDIVEGIKKGLI